MALLPPWFPTEAALLALVVLVVAVLVMNRGNWWIINVLAADEPLLVAIGAFVFALALAGTFSQLGLGPQTVWLLVGAAVAAIGIVARYTDLIDVEGLI